ncbi:hypothetical protein BDV41DRAFT_305076 [Aspergillus transmontanensis]|uniref:C2H2-type domain-containing protein n=1 Tax=Aspergillus transmontanensis TaxID=1034304 RepID=A0A5N6VUL2_9EURO|nr:hypothetical protein BDV41DRAFT_305076 [Aspergillus transmontanensis]
MSRQALPMPPRKKHRMSPVERVGEGQARRNTSSPSKKNRLFRCQFCAREFQRNEHLQRHERLRRNSNSLVLNRCKPSLIYYRYEGKALYLYRLSRNLYPK